MKKIFALFLLVLCMLVGVASAETFAALTEGPADFFTWATIGTFAGAVAMTVFIVQAVKMPLDKVFGHIPTRLIVYVISLALLLLSATFTNGGLTVESVALSVVNGFLVMLAAMSTYTMLIEQTEARKVGRAKAEATEPPEEEAAADE